MIKIIIATLLLVSCLILICIVFLNDLTAQVSGFVLLTALLIMKRGLHKTLEGLKIILPFILTLALVYLIFGLLRVKTSAGETGSLLYWAEFGVKRLLLFANSVLIFQNFFAWVGIDELISLPLSIGLRKYLILGKTLYYTAFSSYGELTTLFCVIPTEQLTQKTVKHRFKARLAVVLAMFQTLVSDARTKGQMIDNRLIACHGKKTLQTGTWYLTVGFTVIVTVATIIIPIPVPGGGFFNFGDVIIVFIGLYAGSKAGAIAGGIGSAIADLMLFPLFAPITFITKGCEGFLCGLAHRKRGFLTLFFPVLGAVVLIVGYFLGELLMPQFGLTVAVADLPANVVQASVGLIGGRALFAAAKYLNL